MKKLLMTVFFVFCVGIVSVPCWSEDESKSAPNDDPAQSICPFTMMSDQKSCRDCHEVTKTGGKYKWGINDDGCMGLPYATKIITKNGRDCLYYLLNSIDDDKVFEIYNYCTKNNIDQIEMEIQSPGGSVVNAWRIVGIIESHPEIHLTTRCNGLAASAGFVIFASGHDRVVSPRAMMLCHELWSLSFLKIETPAGTKDEAENMQIWQDNLNEWLAEHSKMTADEISDKIKHKNWWMVGRTAYELGFADRLVWDRKEPVGFH